MKTLNPNDIPKHFESQQVEQKWDHFWQEHKVYQYDPSCSREETFVVDTPPPTVSGSLHIGHVFSYTHADIVTRFQRMTGKNIFYPMGWDDNGLPTERRVQNYFHVKCDPNAPYEKNLELPELSDKERKKTPPKFVSRPNFVELCHQVTLEDEKAFMNLFKRVGLSVDWDTEYATINDHCRRTAQYSFLDLYNKGHVYNLDAPTMWDVDFQSAVAQAELEDRELPGAFHDIEFAVEGSEESFVISTTRPELLPACVGVAAHPDDERYKGLFGKKAITPLFHVPVPIFPTEVADPEKGTGILMVCTFGDSTDVDWWRSEKLQLRQIIGRDGRLLPVEYGTEGWESLKPDVANTYYEKLKGKKVKGAQQEIVELLKDIQGSATGTRAPLVGEPKKIQHAVKFFEKGDRPLEFVSTRQWFVRLMDKKEALIQKGKEIQWHPSFMGQRYSNWTENLQLDWCISRQRYFGVSFPVWYRLDENGQPDFENPILAQEDQLPVDPMSDTPQGMAEDQRGKPGGFIGESDVFDTWFTSSLSPQIGSHWGVDKERHSKLFPATIRPQSHEIIRTWAFYTIAKALLHEEKIPWEHVIISGWILDPDRKKMSKSKGNVVTPLHLLDEFSADGVRYWAANARLGVDTAFDQKVFKVGKRLVTKIYNASKFALSHEPKSHTVETYHPLDQAFLKKLEELTQKVTAHFKDYNYSHALMETENFFWQSFTDNYLELSKARAWKGDPSAIATLRTGLNILLRLFAPTMPYITEEVWSWAFAEETGEKTIHRAPWPSSRDFESLPVADSTHSLELAMACWAAINKAKSQEGVSAGRELNQLKVSAHPDTFSEINPVLDDVIAAARAHQYEMLEDASCEKGVFSVTHIEIAEKKT